MEKLKALKPVLKLWNREVFGNIEQKKKGALDCIVAWDEVENNLSLTVSELGEREEARGDIESGRCLKRSLGDKSLGRSS